MSAPPVLRERHVKTTVALALVAYLIASPALAGPCGFKERGRVVVNGYGVGATAVPETERERLKKFAETAKTRDGICVFAQVDKQGTKEANKKVAQQRAEGVRKFLINQGVLSESIVIAKQEEAFTLFGLLSDDNAKDRRVMVTHD